MSAMMLHGLGDCTPERHCGCLSAPEPSMPTNQEVIITEEMRAPDERVKVNPFRNPWVKGTDTDPECGRTWHDHGWIDRGDHGFTVCPTEAERPDVVEERVREASEVTSETSDGHHTFAELYEYRMLYNAHAAQGWLAAGIPVVKSTMAAGTCTETSPVATTSSLRS